MMQKDPSLVLFIYNKYLWFILPESSYTLLLPDICPWMMTLWTSSVASPLARFLLGSDNLKTWVGSQKMVGKWGWDIYSFVVLSVPFCRTDLVTSWKAPGPLKVACSLGISFCIVIVTVSFLVSLAVGWHTIHSVTSYKYV